MAVRIDRAPPAAAERVPFVGREPELRRLAAALERAAEGRPSHVLVRAPAGRGATRLIVELRHRLAVAPEAAVVLAGTAYAPLSGVPYAPLAIALGDALDGVDDGRLPALLGTAAHDVARLLPAVGERLIALGVAVEPPPVSAPDRRQGRFFEGILRLLGRLADGRPVLLVLEDLQLADAGTRELVAFLARTAREEPLCLVASYDPDELDRRHPLRPVLAGLAATVSVETIELPPLGNEELASLIEGLEGERPTASLVAAVAERSGGEPLVAETIVAARRDRLMTRLSDSLEEILAARLTLRSTTTVRLLELLAVAGRPLSRDELERVGASLGGLPEALEAGLVRAGSDGAVAVPHRLVEEAIAARMLPAERLRAHALLAHRLAGAAAERAWHAEAAHLLAEARDARLEAGRFAETADSGADALVHYERAIELAYALEPNGGELTSRAPERAGEGLAPPPLELADLLDRAAAAAGASGDHARAAALAAQAIDLAGSPQALRAADAAGGDARSRARFRLGVLHERLARHRWASGDQPGAFAALGRALELVPASPSVERAQLLATVAQLQMLDGRFTESAATAGEAIAAARTVGEPARPWLGHATCTLGVDVSYSGEAARAVALLEEARVIARETGRLDDLMRVYANLTTVLDLELRREEAVAMVQEGIAEARRWGQEHVYGNFLRGNAADCLFTLGRWGECRAMAESALAWNPTGLAFLNPLIYLTMVRVEQSADEEAAQLLGQALIEIETVPDAQYSGPVCRSAASFALWRQDVADARRAIELGWRRILQSEDWIIAATLAATYLEVEAAAADAARGRRDLNGVAEALERADAVLGEAERRVAAGGVAPGRGAGREAEAHLETARAHRGRIAGHDDADGWARLAARWAAVGVPYQGAKARWREAEAALRLRTPRMRTRARTALLEAWRLAAELGAGPLRRQLRELAGRARVPLPEGDAEVELPVAQAEPRAVAIPIVTGPPGPGLAERLLAAGAPKPAHAGFGLSPRESGVLAILVEGRTNREIAERLFISEKTVAIHVGNILAKLGVSGRVEAATVAIRLGLVPLRAPARR